MSSLYEGSLEKKRKQKKTSYNFILDENNLKIRFISNFYAYSQQVVHIYLRFLFSEIFAIGAMTT